jgi:hypothetical protein
MPLLSYVACSETVFWTKNARSSLVRLGPFARFLISGTVTIRGSLIADLGHWDGDTLVVETTGFRDDVWLNVELRANQFRPVDRERA